MNVTDHDPARPVRIGDEVVLLGRQGNEEVSIDELAEKNATTTFQLLLRLGNNNRTIPIPPHRHHQLPRAARASDESTGEDRTCDFAMAAIRVISRIVEDEFTSCDAAIHVIDRFGDE